MQWLRVGAPLEVVAFSAVAVLAFWNLEYYPQAWFDEGVNLVGAKTLAQTGVYGTQASEGIKRFDIMLTTGPTVIGPVVLAFKLFGVGLYQARVVMAVYIVLAALGLYWAGRQLYGRNVALVALFVFASLSEAGPFDHGRQVIGEIPAVAYLLWGAGFIIWASRTGRSVLLLPGGLLIGLAILTKAQILQIVPLFVVLWLGARVRSHNLELVRLAGTVAAMLAPLLFWQLYQLWVLGPAEFQKLAAGNAGQVGYSGLGGLSWRAFRSLEQLMVISFLPLGMCSLMYAWALVCQTKRQNLECVLLLAFTTLWLVFYVVVSVGWIRYSVLAVVCSSLFTAKLLFDLGCAMLAEGWRGRGQWIRAVIREPFPALLLSALSLPVILGLPTNFERVTRWKHDQPHQFAELLMDRLPSDTLVENYEWEISFLTDRDFHHPPVELVTNANNVDLGRQPAESMSWYRVPIAADYLVDGQHSKQFRIYQAELGRGEFSRIASVGKYDLYQRIRS